MGWHEPQRRRSHRVAVDLDVALRRERGNPVTAHTVDLGRTGMRVQSERPLAVDEVLRFDLELPAPAGHLEGEARVVREQGPGLYALRLVHLDPAGTRTLSRFVGG